MSITSQDEHRLTIWTKIAYGAGGGAEAISLFAVSSYAMLFYNQVLGLPAHLAGLAISASLLLDGLTDPLVGSISDRTRSRMGRRHGYMFAAPIPIALSLLAVFNPPQGLSTTWLFVWFAVSVVFLRQAMTLFHTPHLALGGELSRNYTERSRIQAYNSFLAFVGAAVTSWLALTYFFKASPEYPRGLLNPAPYGPYSLLIAGLTLTILFASAWFTRDQIARLPMPAADTPQFSAREFLGDLRMAISNRNYVWLLIAYFFLSLMVGLRGGLNLYTATYFWQLTSEQLRWFIVGSFIGFFAAFIFAARLHDRFDKRATIIVTALLYVVGPAVPILLGMAGLFFAPGSPWLLAALVGFSVIGYGSLSVLNISIMSALADVADENELRFGVRQEGVLYATRALAAKVDQALGALVAGLALTLIHFPAQAKPGQVDPQIVWNLALWDAVVAGLPGVIAVIFYARYRITRDTHAATAAALRARAGPDNDARPADAIGCAPGVVGIDTVAPAPP